MTSPTVTHCGSLPLATTLVRTSLSVIMPWMPSSLWTMRLLMPKRVITRAAFSTVSEGSTVTTSLVMTS